MWWLDLKNCKVCGGTNIARSPYGMKTLLGYFIPPDADPRCDHDDNCVKYGVYCEDCDEVTGLISPLTQTVIGSGN